MENVPNEAVAMVVAIHMTKQFSNLIGAQRKNNVDKLQWIFGRQKNVLRVKYFFSAVSFHRHFHSLKLWLCVDMRK